jgi:hypothetical protein
LGLTAILVFRIGDFESEALAVGFCRQEDVGPTDTPTLELRIEIGEVSVLSDTSRAIATVDVFR